MPGVYVSGPVIRHSPEWDLPLWIQDLYARLQKEMEESGQDVILPESTPELERSKPAEFFRAIRQRIGHAKAVVSVFTAGDVSAGVEACIASAARKKILVISEDPEEAPRLVAGLPGVVGVLSPSAAAEADFARLLGLRPGNGPTRPRPGRA